METATQLRINRDRLWQRLGNPAPCDRWLRVCDRCFTTRQSATHQLREICSSIALWMSGVGW
ncbi:MAG: hypothetical protein AAF921_11900 [Cyanobacteria bacterium P01_D01_bin.44]